MAEVVQEKSRGLKFAEQQLLRHGWEQGKGLGRAENGISEAIKVKVKCNKGGFGHKEGDQFTFHWWDHVFNKASSSLQVESDQNGVQVKKSAEDEEEDGMISNKKPGKATLAKDKLYGCFVKSATLLSGQEQPEPKSSASDDSSSSEEEDDQKLDLSTTFKLSDADLIKACGGRTAHKGARHGLTMSAKLARLEQQEAEFMAKYGKKSQPGSGASQSAVENSLRKKGKSTGGASELNDKVPENPEMDIKPKKKKKKKRGDEDAEGDVMRVESSAGDPSDGTKRKKKNNAEKEEESASSPAEASGGLVETTEFVNKKKKKKKKKRKSPELQCDLAAQEEADDTEPTQDRPLEGKRKKSAILLEAADGGEQEVTVKQKRKKCKKDKARDGTDEEEAPPKKKKKKKSKE